MPIPQYDPIEGITLDRLQRELAPWQAHNFPTSKPDDPFKGVVEELGELAHSLLKRDQGIRGTAEEHTEKAKDAVGDLLVFLADLCNRQGWSMQECLELGWGTARVRDFQRFPKNGLTE